MRQPVDRVADHLDVGHRRRGRAGSGRPGPGPQRPRRLAVGRGLPPGRGRGQRPAAPTGSASVRPARRSLTRARAAPPRAACGTTSTPDAGGPAPRARVAVEHATSRRHRRRGRATAAASTSSGTPAARHASRAAADRLHGAHLVVGAAQRGQRRCRARRPRRVQASRSTRPSRSTGDRRPAVGSLGRAAAAGRAPAPRSARPPTATSAPRRRGAAASAPRTAAVQRGRARGQEATSVRPGAERRRRRPRGPRRAAAGPARPSAYSRRGVGPAVVEGGEQRLAGGRVQGRGRRASRQGARRDRTRCGPPTSTRWHVAARRDRDPPQIRAGHASRVRRRLSVRWRLRRGPHDRKVPCGVEHVRPHRAPDASAGSTAAPACVVAAAALFAQRRARRDGTASSGWLPLGRRRHHRAGRPDHDLWIGSWIAALVVGVFVWGLMIWCVIAYRRQEDRRRAARAAPLQPADRDPLHGRAAVHGRGAVLLHRPRRGGHCSTPRQKPDVTVNVVGKQWSWDFNYVDADVYEPARRPSSTGKPATQDDAPDALPAGRQAGRVRPQRARRHPLVLGAGVPAEARHHPGQANTLPGRPDPGRAPTRASAPSSAAPTTRRCSSRSRSSPQAEFDAAHRRAAGRGPDRPARQRPQPRAGPTEDQRLMPASTGSS